MPSNVRRYERSCRWLHKRGEKFYQCETCDPGLMLYICTFCFQNGDHQNHDTTEARSNDVILFCNCGDRAGLFSCKKHKQNVDTAKPLHVVENALDEFAQTFNITDRDELLKLSRINQIIKVNHNSKDGVLISNYFKSSNAHKMNFHIRRSWSVLRKDHENKFVENKLNQERRFLLWHGTKVANLISILNDGFKRPGTNPSNGRVSMFGNGVYFADRVSKSTRYSDKRGPGLLFLCEVALGSMYRQGAPVNYQSPPTNYKTVKGVGKNIPDKNGQLKFDRRIIVPAGKTIPNPELSVPNTSLNYNEYVVFDPARILIKFIVQFER